MQTLTILQNFAIACFCLIMIGGIMASFSNARERKEAHERELSMYRQYRRILDVINRAETVGDSAVCLQHIQDFKRTTNTDEHNKNLLALELLTQLKAKSAQITPIEN